MQRAKTPSKVGKRHVFIETDVVDEDIAVSLSKKTMKTTETQNDFENQKVT